MSAGSNSLSLGSVGSRGRPRKLSAEPKLVQNSWTGVHIGVITAGDEAQGVNAALRAIVRMGLYLGAKVTYIKFGFKGLIDGSRENFIPATWYSTTDCIGRAGTYIKSFKSERFKERDGRLLAAKHLIGHGIDHLVVIGGDGTLKGCHQFQAEWISLLRELDDRNMADREEIVKHRHLRVMCIPCSITNDLCGTDMCIGVDSALHRIVEAIDNITTTSRSGGMAFVLEVLGGHSGYLALVAGLICDASMVFIPEYPSQGDWRDELYDKVRDNLLSGVESIICILSEGTLDKNGAIISSESIREVLDKKLGLNAKTTVLGDFLRGGNPSAYDRLLATRFGSEAVMALRDQDPLQGAMAVSICANEILTVPVASCLEATVKCRKHMKDQEFNDAIVMKGWHFQEILNSFNWLHSMRSSPVPDLSGVPGTRKIGIMRLGKSSVAQCWIVKAVVGYCHSKHCWPIVIRDGFEGLVKGRYFGMTWDEAKDIHSKDNACLGFSSLTAAAVGLEKVAHAIRDMNLHGLIIVGGFPAFTSLTQIEEAQRKFRFLRIPMCMIPVTVVNNIPGTDAAIGSDTALNEIVAYCDKMKRAARGYQDCVFIIETGGHNCGYLATVGALVCGADASYIKQDKFTLDSLLEEAAHLRDKMQMGLKIGLILRGEKANENYTTDFLNKLFSEEGRGYFSCRSSTIGHLQVGALPSPQDRCTAICNGFTVAAWMVEALDDNISHANRISETITKNNKTVLCRTGSVRVFEHIGKLSAETNFEETLPLYLWWMDLRPYIRVLSGIPDKPIELTSQTQENQEIFLGGKPSGPNYNAEAAKRRNTIYNF